MKALSRPEMKKYALTVGVTGELQVLVEAATPQVASEIGKRLVGRFSIDRRTYMSRRILEVEEPIKASVLSVKEVEA